MGSSTPGNGSSPTVPLLGGPAVLSSPEQVYTEIGDAGAAAGIDVASPKYTVDGKTYSWAEILTAIAGAESNYQQNNWGDRTLSRYGSVGWFQIFTGAHSPSEVLGTGGSSTADWSQTEAQQLVDPVANTDAAVKVWKEQGFSAWSTYNSGAYKKYLPQAVAAASGAGGAATPLDTPFSPNPGSGPSLSLSGITGDLLAPFSALFSAAGKGLLRFGLILAGGVVLLFALFEIGRT